MINTIKSIDGFLKTKVFPYMTIGYLFLVFYGYVANTAYYNRFNIEIYNYLSASEIFLPSIHVGMYMLVFGLFSFMFLGQTLLDTFYNQEKSNHPNDKLTEQEEGNKKKLARIQISLCSFVMLIPAFLLIFIKSGPTFSAFYWKSLVLIISIVWFILLFVVVKQYSKQNKGEQTPVFLWFLPAFFFITMITSYNATLDSQSIFDGQKIADVSIKHNHGLLVSNDTIFYVGQTSSHMFFWDFYNEEPQIYNLSNFSKTIKNSLTKSISGDISSSRSWEKHPLFNYIDEHMTVNETITHVMIKDEVSIHNNELIIPSHTGLIHEQGQYKKGTPLLKISPPYRLIKQSPGFEVIVIKDKDTLIFKATSAERQ